MKTLFRRLRPFRGAVLVIFAGLLVEMAFNGLLPLALRFLIDSVMGDRHPGKMTALLLFLALGAIAASGMGFLRDREWVRTQAGFLAGLRQEMFDHLQKLSIGFFQSGRGGSVLSTLSGDLATLENTAAMAIPWGLLPGVECIFSSVLLFALDWRLWLAAMTLWPWTMLAPRFSSARARAASASRSSEEAGLLTELQENLAVQPVVKAFGLEALRIASFAKRSNSWRHSAVRAGAANAFLERSTTSGILLIQVGVLGLGAELAFHRLITVGTLVSFQALLMLLSNNLLYVMQYIPSLVQSQGAMERIEELLAEPPQTGGDSARVDLPAELGAIEFRDVSFGYSPDQPILHHVSLVIPPGASVAFVGGSGSGKSTMLNLLMRFYDPDSGAILAGGRNIEEFSVTSWRQRLGVVFQESLLFDLSLIENIRMARPDATDQQIYNAARGAEIHDFIQGLPGGYATAAGERGGRLSGGQRQRIAIARAILRDPAILVLDEATSALDPSTETAVNATLARLAKGRTSISVTHRLSSASSAGLIFVFDAGHLVESGSHLELLKRNGHYAALAKKQHGFEVKGDGSSATIKPERLAEIPILSALPPALLAEIGPLFHSEAFQNGTDIVVEGDSSGKFYIVVRGRVEVLRKGVRIAILEDGDYFGELALLSGSPRNATVRAVSATTCIALDKESFDSLLTKSPGVREQLWRVAAQRLRT